MSLQSPLLVDARRSALTLHERLTVPARASNDAAGATHWDDEEALRRWRDTLDRHGSGTFDRRLRWDGLNEKKVRAALHVEPEPTALPEWAVLLDEACEVAARELDEGDRAIDSAAPIPFEEVLLPFVQVARRRLCDAATSIDKVVAPAAQRSLERALLVELSHVAEQALFTDLSVARSLKGGWSGGFSLGCPGRAAYLEFVNALRASRLEPLVQRYPVLVRLLAVRAGLWVTSSAEFVSRTVADSPDISVLFGGGELGSIVELHTGRGDTHCGGRAVATALFASGLRVMYKPRSMKLDLAFYGLLNWLRERGLEPDQRVLRILDRGEYGWMEYVVSAPLSSEEELRDYYERAGSLLCLSYVLGAGDLHADNLIAAGAHPIVVDLETMMGPQFQGAKAVTSPSSSSSPPNSVLRTLLLPFWNVGPKGQLMFRGGGLGLEHASIRLSQQVWDCVNTDRMSREQRTQSLATPTNVPRLGDRIVPPTERADDIVRGFERCHAFLERNRGELTAAGGALDGFRGRRVRVLIRDTRVYGSALRRSLHPRYLRDGFERSLELEILRVSALGGDEPVGHWRAFEAEQRDLEDLDYPFFSAATDGTMLYDSRGTSVGTINSESAYDQVVDRLARLDTTDREHQASLIRFIYAYSVGPIATVAQARDAADAIVTAIDAPTALAEARAIAAALEALVVRDRDGSAQWVGVDREQSTVGVELRRLRDRFYDGRAGIALFLAALDAIGATGHADLAADALDPLRRTLRDPYQRETLANRVGIGAGLGLGGFVYALAQIGRLANDASWIDDAAHAAREFTPERISSDAILEVLGGAAGAALALLSLHDLTGERWILQRAAACGRRLLDSAAEEPATGRRAWRLASGNFGTGFAHGAGGIAAALLRLANATGNEAFASAAAEGFGFEDAISDAPRPEIPHLAAASAKATAESPWRQTWCNGPIGVALGRAIFGDSAPIAAVAHARSHDITASPDHPCCGAMGPAELLLVTGHSEDARAIAATVVTRAREKQSYQISRDVPEARTTPVFFQGLAGIGYQLLRLTHGERLRSALAFQ